MMVYLTFSNINLEKQNVNVINKQYVYRLINFTSSKELTMKCRYYIKNMIAYFTFTF